MNLLEHSHQCHLLEVHARVSAKVRLDEELEECICNSKDADLQRHGVHNTLQFCCGLPPLVNSPEKFLGDDKTTF